MAAMDTRYAYLDLIDFASNLLSKAGLPADRARIVAEILVEGDLLGHSTHGLQLLKPYLKSLVDGTMATDKQYEVLQDRGAAIAWDGNYLPGPWLVTEAMKLGFERMQDHPVFCATIQRSHHIACLESYLMRATERGLVILLMSSDPAATGVAPFGGREAVFTPNPLAAGIPTHADPILIDVSMSITTIGMTMRYNKLNAKMPGRWLLDSQGKPSDDPAVLFAEPPGSILPLGGMQVGHKGFALALLIEALTSALSGYGRVDKPDRWGASVFLQLIDPDAFGGREHFMRETSWLSRACQATQPIDPQKPVRMPGQTGLSKRRAAMQSGVSLGATIYEGLLEAARIMEVPLPQPLA